MNSLSSRRALSPIRLGLIASWLLLLLWSGQSSIAYAARLHRSDRQIAADSPGNQQPLNAPARLRIQTEAPGLYRLVYADLSAAGLPLPTAFSAFGLTCGGEAVGLDFLDAGADALFGPGDAFVFYAQAYEDRYQNINTCFLAWQQGVTTNPDYRAMAVHTQSGGDDLPLTTRITRTLRVETNAEYRSAYALEHSADHWFDLPLLVNSATPTATRTYPVTLTQPITTEGAARITARLYGGVTSGATTAQGVELLWNSATLTAVEWLGNTPYSVTTSLSGAHLQTHNQITLLAARSAISGADSFWVSPDWVAVDYPALAMAEGDRLLLPTASLPAAPARLAVSGFSSPDLLIYAIDNPDQPRRLLGLPIQPDDNSYRVVLPIDHPDAAYAVSTVEALRSPRSITVDQPSAWATPDQQADYIAIVHRRFWEAIDPLLDHRQQEGLAVAKVDVQDIYDEFAFGRTDPEAIRSFLAYAYHNWNQGGSPPQYVLLVGDGHYDFKGYSGTPLGNFIPPYLIAVDPWLGETAADNRYVSIDGPDDYLPEMSIGRIPAQTPDDVTAVVEKILAYEAAPPSADWRKRVVFVADAADDPAYNFHAVSDEMAAQLPEAYESQRIYYGSDHPDGEAMRSSALVIVSAKRWELAE